MRLPVTLALVTTAMMPVSDARAQLPVTVIPEPPIVRVIMPLRTGGGGARGDTHVSLLRYDPARQRAVTLTTHVLLGARSGEAVESLAVFDVPSGRRRFHNRIAYRTHPGLLRGPPLGRYSGAWRTDVRRLTAFMRAEGVDSFLAEDELVVSPDGTHIVVETQGRARAPTHGLYLATGEGQPLHPIQSDDMGLIGDRLPVFSPGGGHVAYGCMRAVSGSPRARQGLCVLDVDSGQRRYTPVGTVDDARWVAEDRLVVLERESVPARPSSGSRFRICLHAVSLERSGFGPPREVRCWDDSWAGSRIAGSFDDDSVVLSLRSPRGRGRVLRVARDGRVLQRALSVPFATSARLLCEGRVVVRSERDGVGFVNLETGRTVELALSEGARLESVTALADGDRHLVVGVYRSRYDARFQLVELDLTRL